MGWSSLSFPFGSLLTAAQMTQVYSNFASVMAQESNAPPPSGVWSFQGQVRVASDFFAPGSSGLGQVTVGSGLAAPGVSSFDTLNVASGLSGNVSMVRAQGYVNLSGSVLAGANLAASHQATGVYVCAFSASMPSSIYPVHVTPVGRVVRFHLANSTATNMFFAAFFDLAANPADPASGFSVTVYG